MRRLVAMVGSTANKFEQAHPVRVRDFANRPRPEILNPDDVKALDEIRGLFAYGIAPDVAACNGLTLTGHRCKCPLVGHVVGRGEA
jgi:hypothetical protein